MPVTIRHLTHIYDVDTPWEIKALDRIDLSIMEGGVFGLVGEMGSGKSTLATFMAGLENPTYGKITIDGDSPRPGMNVGILFQQPEDFFFEKTLFRDMVSVLKNKGLTQEEIKLQIHSSLDMVGLDHQILDMSPIHLNRGTLRLAAFASVLAMRPKYLILDEPTASLDPHSRNKVIEIINKVSKDVTIIYISHRLQEIAAISDHMAVMEQGRIAFTGIWQDYVRWAVEQNKAGDLPVLSQVMIELQHQGLDVDPAVNSLELAVEQVLRVKVP